jgi:PAS domain S-box-containing protein
MSDRPPCILYVDDNENQRQVMTWLLQSAGFQTREAGTGSEALRLAADEPDLIILDIDLPDLNGFEVCRRIKAHPATASIPVLHLSGVFIHPEDRSHGLEGGADAYLTKPVEPCEAVATVRALLRMRRAEEAARGAARDWQATFDAIHDPLCLLDPAGRLRRCNRALAELVGRPPTLLIGRPFRDLLAEAFGPSEEVLAVANLPAPEELPREVALGGRWFRLTADVVTDGQGAVTGSVRLLADVTRRRVLEEQLRQAQKLEAIGRLAGGIAHDFNNLLTAVTGNLALTLSWTGPEDRRRDPLLLAERAAWRAAELTRQLLGFARQAPFRPRPLDLNSCVRETVDLLRGSLGAAVTVEMHCDERLSLVPADAGQMGQVLMNLCLNARDAMPTGGHIRVQTEVVPLEALLVPEGVSKRSRAYARLRVSDNGPGISPEVLPRIFDPFFTTKETGRGTGLGLAVVFGIVQQHGGWVECHSRPGEGARFDVYLPLGK